MLKTVPASKKTLLSTLRALPDDRRAELERELVPLLRDALLGRLAGDIAHDLANPLFGAIGLVELLRAQPNGERLRLLHETTLELKDTLQQLVDFTRDDGSQHVSLDEALRVALRLLRHGGGRLLAIEESYADPAVVVQCPQRLLVQALLELLLAGGAATVAVDGAELRLSPAPAESVETFVAARIVADHGGSVTQVGDTLVLRFA